MSSTQSKRSRKNRNKSGGATPAAKQAAGSATGNAPGSATRSLPAQWQDWIAENLNRGCQVDEMTKVMAENGFEPDFAHSAISVIRDMARRVRDSGVDVGELSGYDCDPIRLPPAGSVDVDGHSIGIGFVMTDPNVALLEDIISADECAELIEMSRGKLKRSQVVNRETGGFEVNSVRTSEGTHFDRGENDLIKRLENRIAQITGLPIENGEPFQILHYGVGGEYLPHHDYFEPEDPGSKVHVATGGQRVATLVIYLNTVAEGGETELPNVDLAVRARVGNAIYFEYLNKDGQLDDRCLHAGVPVLAGEKWVATKWLRQFPYVRG